MAGRTLLQGGVVACALVHKRDPMSLAVDLLKAGSPTMLLLHIKKHTVSAFAVTGTRSRCCCRRCMLCDGHLGCRVATYRRQM